MLGPNFLRGANDRSGVGFLMNCLWVDCDFELMGIQIFVKEISDMKILGMEIFCWNG